MGREGYLGEFEQMLLLAAMRLEDEAYGVALIQELETRVGRAVSHGSVYVTLGRLEDKGWRTKAGSPRRFPLPGPSGAGARVESSASRVRVWRHLRSRERRS